MGKFVSIEWDESKRLSNLDKHYLDFEDAIHVLRGPYLRAPASTVEGEVRWIATGMLDDVHVSLIYTLRGSVLRVISMRKARKGEKRQYEKIFGS